MSIDTGRVGSLVPSGQTGESKTSSEITKQLIISGILSRKKECVRKYVST